MKTDSIIAARENTNADREVCPGFVLAATLACSGILIALVLSCYLRTLGTYFLADDFGEILWVSRIWSGEWNLYLSDWTSNVQQLPGMAVYRPWFITTLLMDYAIWHGNAFGYYLTQVTYFVLNVLLLFAVTRTLTARAGVVCSLLASFFSAALFAVNPLHCESVSWSGGRTDNIACTYFLAGLLCFLLSRRRRYLTAFAIAFFWLSILTKEMGIALPVVITAISFLFPVSSKIVDGRFFDGLKTRMWAVVVETYPYWICTAIYFVIRYLALGTFGGGYTGGLGGDSLAAALQRLFDWHNLSVIIYPFAVGIVSPKDPFVQIITFASIGAWILLALRALRREISAQNVILLAVWAAATTLPILHVWGIGLNLEGARYFFFLTVPMSMCLPLLLMTSLGSPEKPQRFSKITAFAVVLLTMLVIADAKICSKTNGAWIHAGKEVRALLTGARQIAGLTPGGKDVPVLGLPREENGAHMIYNGATFLMALGKPFSDKKVDVRFLTFTPVFYGAGDLINPHRFKEALRENATQPYVWNSSDRRWVPSFLAPACAASDPLDLSPYSSHGTELQPDPSPHGAAIRAHNFDLGQPGQPGQSRSAAQAQKSQSRQYPVTIEASDCTSFSDISQGVGMKFAQLDLNPLAYDFLEFQYRLPKSSDCRDLLFTATWRGTSPGDGSPALCAAIADEKVDPTKLAQWQCARIPLSHFWHWYACSNITELSLILPALKHIDITRVRLLSDRHLKPELSLRGKTPDQMGTYYASKAASLAFDATAIPGAVAVRLETTKPNVFFDQISTLGLQSWSYASVRKETADAVVGLDSKLCPQGALCEVRARALGRHGEELGEYSDPLTVAFH